MGRLAWAGAMKGVGEGLHEMGADKMEAEATAAKQTHDDARAEALIRLKARLDSEARQAEYAQQTSIQNLKGSQAESLQKGEQGFKSKEADYQRQFEAVQTDKKLESAEEVARIGAAAKTTAAGKNPKWKINTVKTGGDFNPATGQTTPVSTYQTITSEETGLTYKQEGNMFLPQDENARAKVKMPAKEKMAAAMKWLAEDPKTNAQKFISIYGWLPAPMMRYLKD